MFTRGLIFAIALLAGCATPPDPETPESRAVAYLVREVPAWFRENGCFSCHNNGDGARALMIAAQQGYRVPAAALANTLAWLRRPEAWDNNQGDPAFSDKTLAHIQFAAALGQSGATGLDSAAGQVAQDQAAGGAWEIDALGSPVTYGTALATYMALRTLNASSYQEQTGKAWRWFAQLDPKNNVAAAALLLAARLEPHRLNTDRALVLLTESQNPDGGWGPYAHAPSEPFDTALALLALENRLVPEAQSRARRFLLQHQLPDGSWPATTRPPGGDSYAQQVSTSAWALLALLATRSETAD